MKKFEEYTCMRLYSVKQNIEGDANLHHPSPGIGLKEFQIKIALTIKFFGHHLKYVKLS